MPANPRPSRPRLSHERIACLIGTLSLAAGAHAAAPAEPVDGDIQQLQRRIAEQSRRLDELKRTVASEEAQLKEIRRVLGASRLETIRGTADPAPAADTGTAVNVPNVQPIPQVVVGEELAPSPAQPQAQAPAEVRQDAPEKKDNRPLQVAPIFEQPGVLTPKGKYVLEPSLQYAYASSNQVALVGYTIIPALVIGLIDIREVKRNTATATMTGRFGITNRFELEAKIPYAWRSDDTISRPIGTGSATDSLFGATGKGLGDVEVTGRYQLNDGGDDKPYYVGTLRFKSHTGKDPFEVLTVTNVPGGLNAGLQQELPTGSGFYTLQPGLTVLYASDPAVFFGSVSYQYNFKRKNVSLNTDTGPVFLGDVQPGGVFGFNFGMGLALNDKASFSIGYDHASVGRTQVNGEIAQNSVVTQLGTLLLGFSYRLTPQTSLNLSVGVGVTRDAPDVQLSLRLPMTF